VGDSTQRVGGTHRKAVGCRRLSHTAKSDPEEHSQTQGGSPVGKERKKKKNEIDIDIVRYNQTTSVLKKENGPHTSEYTHKNKTEKQRQKQKVYTNTSTYLHVVEVDVRVVGQRVGRGQ